MSSGKVNWVYEFSWIGNDKENNIRILLRTLTVVFEVGLQVIPEMVAGVETLHDAVPVSITPESEAIVSISSPVTGLSDIGFRIPETVKLKVPAPAESTRFSSVINCVLEL